MNISCIIRKTDNIRGEDNGVLYFNYIKKVSQNYPGFSLESLYQDREQGYLDILLTLIQSANVDPDQNILGYYSEFESLQDNSKILKYKGFWWLKESLNKKYEHLPWEKYPFLTNKKEFTIPVGEKLRMCGLALLHLNDKDQLDDLVKSVSYKINRGFFFIINKKYLAKFEEAIQQADYSNNIDAILALQGAVFILLGEVDYKISHIVTVSNNNMISKIISNLERNSKIQLTSPKLITN